MASFLYHIAETIARFQGHKKVFSLKAPEFSHYVECHKNTQKKDPPRFIAKGYLLSTKKIQQRPCYVLSPRNPEPVKKVVLFLHGGGFIFEMHWTHWSVVSKLVDKLSIPVWVPAYPLLPDNELLKIVEMIFAVYADMRKQYPEADIIFLGDSAGANLALSFCHHNKKLSNLLPMPDRLILVSPAMATERDPVILEEMRRIEPFDIMLSPQLMESMTNVFHLDPSYENYFSAPLYGDFCGFPPLSVFAGTHDSFFPQIPRFVERVRSDGIPVEFIRGEGMMHVWPYIPVAKECTSALSKIFYEIRR
ncbi:esterase [Spirochaetia bacterium]|nr:esterase [Spirochaetia bacterium]GHU31330.1 esterase [Spirochaetia bacterium]